MDKPTIGRIVHYRSPHNEVAPAIVTAVQGESSVNLTVFPDNAPLRFVTSVLHESAGGDRSWCWPPRAPAPQ